jgi:hypothetical protein
VLPLLTALAAAAAAPAAAAERYPDRSRWLVGLELGWAKFAMDDINGVIREFNADTTVADIDEIKDGVDFGVFLGRRLTSSLTVGVKYTRLDASTDLADPTGAFEINAGANVWNGFLHYVPPLDGGLAYGVGADLGWTSTTGEINVGRPNVIELTDKLEGSALALAGYLILEAQGTRTVSFQGQIGYRHAPITDVTISGVAWDRDLDHSGFFVRASFRLHP